MDMNEILRSHQTRAVKAFAWAALFFALPLYACGDSKEEPRGTGGGGSSSGAGGTIETGGVGGAPGAGQAGASAGGAGGAGGESGVGATGGAGTGGESGSGGDTGTGGTTGGGAGAAGAGGGPNPEAGIVHCGPQDCDITQFVCCIGWPLSYECKDSCGMLQAAQKCDGPEDCPGGQVCCAGFPSGSSCKAGCTGQDQQVCHTTNDCTGPDTCQDCPTPGGGPTARMCTVECPY